VAILRAPEQQGRIAMFFNVAAFTPVLTEVVFAGALQPSPTPSDESIDIKVPLVEAWPGAPDVAVARLDATFGPRGLVYYAHTHGKLVPYTPKGVLLPRHCPRGGFRFVASLAFLGGAGAVARTRVPCVATGRTGSHARPAIAG
jgi:hypothetical protein